MTDNQQTAVVNILTAYFFSGIRMNDDILSFARSALNVTTPDELMSLVLDEDEYGGGIVDLLFSPENGIRTEIEQVIPPAGIPIEYHKYINSSVAERIHSVSLHLPGDDDPVVINLSEQMICRFVKKLHLEKNLEYMGIPFPDNPVKPGMFIRARVMLRSGVFTSTPLREHFLGKLFTSLMRHDEIGEQLVIDCLDFIIRLFRGRGEDIDVNTLLSDKININRSIIERKKNFIEYSRTSSMEYLMSQKIYDPPESMNSLMRDIILANIINYVVSENTDALVQGVKRDDGILNREGLDEMIRLLGSIES